MRFYNQTHRYYCGVDLHARSMFVHVLDHEGQTRFEQDLPAGPVLQSRVPNYYMKQIAQAVALNAAGEREVRNEVTVGS